MMIVDHDIASESFCKHWKTELRFRGGYTKNGVWTEPPLSNSLILV